MIRYAVAALLLSVLITSQAAPTAYRATAPMRQLDSPPPKALESALAADPDDSDGNADDSDADGDDDDDDDDDDDGDDDDDDVVDTYDDGDDDDDDDDDDPNDPATEPQSSPSPNPSPSHQPQTIASGPTFSAAPSFSPDPIVVQPGQGNPDTGDTDDTDDTGNNSNEEAEPKSGVPDAVSTASAPISALALVGIAFAILAPALIIYWFVRRRREGFETMPATTTDSNTYRAQNFSVDDQ